MRNVLAGTLLLVVALGLLTLYAPATLADWPPGHGENSWSHGRGKGLCRTLNQLCRFCPPSEENCNYFECSACGCTYLCDNGLSYFRRPLATQSVPTTLKPR